MEEERKRKIKQKMQELKQMQQVSVQCCIFLYHWKVWFKHVRNFWKFRMHPYVHFLLLMNWIFLYLISQFKAEREARALAEGLIPSNASNNSNNNMTNSVPAPVVEPAPVPNKRRYALFLRILICCFLFKCFVRVAVTRCYYRHDLDFECLFLFINFDWTA